MVRGQVDQRTHPGKIKAGHGAGIIAHALRCQHQGLGGQGAGAHGLVPLHLRPVAVVTVQGGEHGPAGLGRHLRPIPFGLPVPGLQVRAENHEQRGLGHLRLIPGGLPDLPPQFRVADHHEPPVLHVEGGGRKQGQREQPVDLLPAQAVVRVEPFHCPTNGDGVKGFHRLLLSPYT